MKTSYEVYTDYTNGEYYTTSKLFIDYGEELNNIIDEKHRGDSHWDHPRLLFVEKVLGTEPSTAFQKLTQSTLPFPPSLFLTR